MAHLTRKDQEDAKFRLMFEHSADAILLLDTRTNRFVDYNQAALDMLRCGPMELSSLHPSLLSPPAQRIHRPAVRAKDTLDEEGVGKFLIAAKQFEPDWFASIAFLAWTGARAGEALGLHWEDVDFATRTIHLCRSATRGVETRTKTDDPRDVPMHEDLAVVLQAHRQQQIAEQHPGLKSGLVFPNDKGGLRLAQAFAKPFVTCSAAVTQHVTPQVLRRSFNTIMLLRGVDPITLRAIMGHVSAEMTERYAGIPMKAKLEAVARAMPRLPTV